MRLTTKQQQTVLDNLGLVYHAVRKLGVNSSYLSYEDVISVGTLGLINAVLTFDESRHIQFSTYAVKCVENEILLYFRTNKKDKRNISLDEVVTEGNRGNVITLKDKIEDSNSDFITNIILRDYLADIVCMILNILKPRDRIIMLYRLAGEPNIKIAKHLNLSESVISGTNANATLRIKRAIHQHRIYNKIFIVDIVEDSYKVTFSDEDASIFKDNYIAILKENTRLPNLNVVYNEGWVTLKMPADEESFRCLAEVLQLILK